MTGNDTKTVCNFNKFRRPRYFHGMLLDDKDFMDEQGYHADKRRLLNRTLHGSGVVCGLDLNGRAGGQAIEVTPGLALDCCGNEIWVGTAVKLDLAKLLPPKVAPTDKKTKYSSGNAKDEKEADDPEKKTKTYYLGIRYEEKGTDPVSVYLPGADCQQPTCDYSRYKEGYCLEIVECVDKKYPDGILQDFSTLKYNEDRTTLSNCWSCDELNNQNQKDAYSKCLRLEEFCEQSVPCPECSSPHDNCHVILGRIEVDEKGCIVDICINDCREYVITGRMVKHLLVSTFNGLKHIPGMDDTPEIQDISALAENPIKALCWILRYSEVVKDTKKTETPKESPDKQPYVTASEFGEHQAAMKKQMDTFNKQAKPTVSKTEYDNLKTQLDELKAYVERNIKPTP